MGVTHHAPLPQHTTTLAGGQSPISRVRSRPSTAHTAQRIRRAPFPPDSAAVPPHGSASPRYSSLTYRCPLLGRGKGADCGGSGEAPRGTADRCPAVGSGIRLQARGGRDGPLAMTGARSGWDRFDDDRSARDVSAGKPADGTLAAGVSLGVRPLEVCGANFALDRDPECYGLPASSGCSRHGLCVCGATWLGNWGQPRLIRDIPGRIHCLHETRAIVTFRPA